MPKALRRCQPQTSRLFTVLTQLASASSCSRVAIARWPMAALQVEPLRRNVSTLRRRAGQAAGGAGKSHTWRGLTIAAALPADASALATGHFQESNGRHSDALSAEELTLLRGQAAKRELTPQCRHWLEHGENV